MACYSHSKLSTFEQCTQKYKFQYIDKIRVPGVGVEAFMGTLVHDVLEKLYRDLKDNKVHSLKFLLAYFNEAWKSRWNDDIIVVKNDPESYRVIGEECISNYYHKHFPFKEGETIGLETNDFLKLDASSSYSVRIDRLVKHKDGTYEVHDYKTGSRVPTQENIDSDRQLAMYAVWVRDKFVDCTDVKLVWHYLASNQDLISKRSLGQLKMLKADVLARIADIERNKSYEPRVSRLCDWCQYKKMCPAFDGRLEETTIAPDETVEITPFVDKYTQLNAQKKQIEEEMDTVRAKILEYVRKEGLSVATGTESAVTVKTIETMKAPGKSTLNYASLVSALKEAGKWEDVVKIDMAALKKAMVAWPGDLQKQVEELIEKTNSERVTISKA